MTDVAEAGAPGISGQPVPAPIRLSIIGHAGLYLEAGDISLLVDPWLSGSCYWRSWWHFPPPPEARPEWLRPRFVYLSHHHFDHFHYPSMRRLARDTQVLVPRFGVDVMREELAGLGFHHVTELAHGRPLQIGEGVTVRSYQYGVDDTALVISRGGTVVADLNDCKIRRRALGQIRRDHGPVTLMLKNYSAAQAYPGCYEARDPGDLGLISRRGYLVDFREAARGLSAVNAVPFASMTCFLHPETYDRNEEVILPDDLARFFDEHPLPGTRLVVMAPGDRWDEQAGFELAPGDAYAGFADRVRVMAEEVRPKIDAAQAEEAARPLRFDRFAEFFEGFARSLPWPLRRMFRGSVVFQVGDEYWTVDVRRRRVTSETHRPADWACLVRTPPGVLADALEKKLVNFIHISMRLHVELQQGRAQTDFLFWGILTMYELGYFPLRQLSWTRLAGAAWARRRELLDTASGMLSFKGSSLERMAGSLMPTGPGQQPG